MYFVNERFRTTAVRVDAASKVIDLLAGSAVQKAIFMPVCRFTAGTGTM
jgi:hypothetical protein